ncbi:thiamine-phosphate kinase [Paenibacillus ginsengarvi]|uniref:Thiamine-monophosphate kinase n=1 Tax=Paenibacillus ginsengarvi TaxID=400777 RepID=A0A3B0CEB0_9BACL|nr:thiamine-phosphate kinase [Paenibacillus ginsengarvi]RKN82279.1 thiamine-phosphate kinase [Paenibacillus ginsengarvi]
MDEFALIRMLNGPRGHGGGKRSPDDSGVTVGIGDDAAVLRPGSGTELVVSCDTMVDGVHFKPETMTFADIGYKAMASNLSDLAAMGARPRWALVALAAPRSLPADKLQGLYDGLYACAEKYATAIVGGDTTSSPSGLVVTVTVIGEVKQGRALLRSAAQPGDAVFVTGPLGGSAAGLRAMLERREAAGPLELLPERLRPLARAHRLPEPRIQAGQLLAAVEPRQCGALNDISDGLASEAWEIAEASGVTLILHGERIPLMDELREYAAAVQADPLEFALYGGEDYELVGTVRPDYRAELERMFEQAGLRLWFVGEVAAAGEDGTDPAIGVTLIRSEGGVPAPVGKRGYNHFA